MSRCTKLSGANGDYKTQDLGSCEIREFGWRKWDTQTAA